MPVKLAVASAVFLLIMVVLEILRSKYVLGVTRANIIIPDLPKEFAGMKVALVADLHQMRFSRYNEELARRIKLQEPDYIFFAGDMGDSRKYNVDAFYDLLEILGDDVPLIAAPGNHDLRLGGGGIHRNFAAECEKAGVILLHNSHIELTAGESKVYIYGYCQDLKATPGRDDARKRAAKKRPKKEKIKIKKGKVEIKKEKTVKDKKIRRKNKHWPLKKVTQEDLAEKLGECPADAPVLLVAHDPGGFKKYAKWGAKLVFS
ncbi:MAG: metallophosphoesterase, partial [Oscillospiraceae bacterium]|nr:metallophosphoesterase [Oscillospiraceae bacterium]